MKNLIKKLAILCAAFLCANFALALNLPSGIANAVSAGQASASDKAAVATLMQDFQGSFASLDENSTVADLKKAAESLKNIDASKCPALVKEKFKAFCGEIESYAQTAQKILKEYNIKDSDLLADVEKLNPDIAQKIQAYAGSLQKAAQEFIYAAMPYLQ